ncbi:protein kinase family protein [Nocardioides sp. Root151]|uniref:protein kinase family protein n=1 Tax=Nocardioides sp. Root151 TaxID=1736475 RepID=UPI0007039CAE|nr:protein kinase family protein [Nocardioides sp. Root151]KQZ68934.1 hypothetical protein ASD66_16970 [Nocardioides sp. Root151]
MTAYRRPGDVIVDRYRLIDLLNEARGARFWLAWDNILARHVAVHLISEDDPRADELRAAARRSARLLDPRLLRVLDIGTIAGNCYVVNEWGEGVSLNNMLAEGPLAPRRAAWLIGEVSETIAAAHASGVAHGRLVPENVLIDERGSVKVIGFAVDAALHGLPEGRTSTEVVDLAGLLYAALTGKWPGISTSSVKPAPQEHGRALRPRQVRAGVPRILDTLCDEVLSPYPGPHDHGYDSAAAIATALMEYVGDPAAMAEAEAASRRGNTHPRLPRIEALVLAPDPVPEPDPEPEPEPEPTPEPEPPARPSPAEETVAGAPVFYDDSGDVGWVSPSPAPPPPPPPPFEEQPARPLFAPDPPEGRAVRTPRPGAEQDSAQYWPWETGTGAVPPAPDDTPGEDDSVPGRNWMRTAWIIAASLLILVAMIYAFNRGRDTDGASDDDEDSRATTTTSARAVLKPVGISDLDPYGDPPEENSDRAPLAIDGDAATAWQTSGYDQNFGPGGLKPGVGLVVDLGEEKQVGSAVATVLNDPTAAELYVVGGDSAPTSVDDLDPVASATSSQGRLVLKPGDAATGRWVVLWLTSVPNDGSYRGRVAEIQVRE